MTRILITGANSYIGMSFEQWLKKWPDEFTVDTVDLMNDAWKTEDFSKYDTVFHVAGIAHIKETEKNADLYYKVNRDIAFDAAQKSKAEGVRQFIFLSSMSVYGLDSGVITKETVPHPKSNYGKSKLQAEELINQLADERFIVTVLRPPMVYGKGCRGNYQALSKFAKKLPVFPDIKNQRSMIYIDNLVEFIRMLIAEQKGGLFCPQNSGYVCTSEMVRLIAKENGHNIRLTRFFNPVIHILKIGIITKIFGSYVYDKSFDNIADTPFEKSIIMAEGNRNGN